MTMAPRQALALADLGQGADRDIAQVRQRRTLVALVTRTAEYVLFEIAAALDGHTPLHLALGAPPSLDIHLRSSRHTDY